MLTLALIVIAVLMLGWIAEMVGGLIGLMFGVFRHRKQIPDAWANRRRIFDASAPVVYREADYVEDDFAVERSTRVCPGCGEPAGATVFWGACGISLARVDRLPTRAEWLDTGSPPSGTEPHLIERGYVQVAHGGRILTDAGIARARELEST